MGAPDGDRQARRSGVQARHHAIARQYRRSGSHHRTLPWDSYPGRTWHMKDVKTMAETGSAVAARKRARDKDNKPPAASAVFSPTEARMLLPPLTGPKQRDSPVPPPLQSTR